MLLRNLQLTRDIDEETKLRGTLVHELVRLLRLCTRQCLRTRKRGLADSSRRLMRIRLWVITGGSYVQGAGIDERDIQTNEQEV